MDSFPVYLAKKAAKFWLLEPLLLVVMIPLLPLVMIAGAVAELKIEYDRKKETTKR